MGLAQERRRGHGAAGQRIREDKLTSENSAKYLAGAANEVFDLDRGEFPASWNVDDQPLYRKARQTTRKSNFAPLVHAYLSEKPLYNPPRRRRSASPFFNRRHGISRMSSSGEHKSEEFPASSKEKAAPDTVHKSAPLLQLEVLNDSRNKSLDEKTGKPIWDGHPFQLDLLDHSRDKKHDIQSFSEDMMQTYPHETDNGTCEEDQPSTAYLKEASSVVPDVQSPPTLASLKAKKLNKNTIYHDNAVKKAIYDQQDRHLNTWISHTLQDKAQFQELNPDVEQSYSYLTNGKGLKSSHPDYLEGLEEKSTVLLVSTGGQEKFEPVSEHKIRGLGGHDCSSISCTDKRMDSSATPGKETLHFDKAWCDTVIHEDEQCLKSELLLASPRCIKASFRDCQGLDIDKHTDEHTNSHPGDSASTSPRCIGASFREWQGVLVDKHTNEHDKSCSAHSGHLASTPRCIGASFQDWQGLPLDKHTNVGYDSDSVDSGGFRFHCVSNVGQEDALAQQDPKKFSNSSLSTRSENPGTTVTCDKMTSNTSVPSLSIETKRLQQVDPPQEEDKMIVDEAKTACYISSDISAIIQNVNPVLKARLLSFHNEQLKTMELLNKSYLVSQTPSSQKLQSDSEARVPGCGYEMLHDAKAELTKCHASFNNSSSCSNCDSENIPKCMFMQSLSGVLPTQGNCQCKLNHKRIQMQAHADCVHQQLRHPLEGSVKHCFCAFPVVQSVEDSRCDAMCVSDGQITCATELKSMCSSLPNSLVPAANTGLNREDGSQHLGRKLYPPWPEGNATPYVLCQHCDNLLEIPSLVPLQGAKFQRLRCSLCLKVSRFSQHVVNIGVQKLIHTSSVLPYDESVIKDKNVILESSQHQTNDTAARFGSQAPISQHRPQENLASTSNFAEALPHRLSNAICQCNSKTGNCETIRKPHGSMQDDIVNKDFSTANMNQGIMRLDGILSQTAGEMRDSLSADLPKDTGRSMLRDSRPDDVSLKPVKDVCKPSLFANSTTRLDGPVPGSSLLEHFAYDSEAFGIHVQKAVWLSALASPLYQNLAVDATIPEDLEKSLYLGQHQDKQEQTPLPLNRRPKFIAKLLKKSLSELGRLNRRKASTRGQVFVNGYQIPDAVVSQAEERAGTIQPGSYWYDAECGFWGVMGGPCLGIIPPFIEELDLPMPRQCTGGKTGVLVNGRELHPVDLDVLAQRGLPRMPGKEYLINISGHVVDVGLGQHLMNLGKLAPTVQKKGLGYGMFQPWEAMLQGVDSGNANSNYRRQISRKRQDLP